MPKPSLVVAALAACLFFASLASCSATMPATGSLERTMEHAVDGQQYNYLLEVPDAAERPEAGWPILIFLHGAGERGDDLERVRFHGPPKLVATFPELASCVLAAPQCPADEWWQLSTLGTFVEELLERPDIDPDRVYLTGLSVGGYATWNLLAAYPDVFAAAVPICGGGQLGRVFPDFPNGFRLEALLEAKHVPVRAFHGELDPIFPPVESTMLVEALQAAGGDAEVTVYPGVEHDSWTETYANPELYTWMFAQSR